MRRALRGPRRHANAHLNLHTNTAQRAGARVHRPPTASAHLHAMTTCQSPPLASCAAAFRPRPDEAPVMMTVGFCVAGLFPGAADLGVDTRSAVDAACATTRAACGRCDGEGRGDRGALAVLHTLLCTQHAPVNIRWQHAACKSDNGRSDMPGAQQRATGTSDGRCAQSPRRMRTAVHLIDISGEYHCN